MKRTRILTHILLAGVSVLNFNLSNRVALAPQAFQSPHNIQQTSSIALLSVTTEMSAINP